MPESNVFADSNVFKVDTEDPRWDPRFVAEIKDFEKLCELKKRREIDSRICPLSVWQQKIVDYNPRCFHAKNDPCWGFRSSGKGIENKSGDSEGKIHDYGTGTIVCECIKDDCPKISKCNKHLSAADKALWTSTGKEKAIYGDAGKLREYYFVDLISDVEMDSYYSLPAGMKEYPYEKNAVVPDDVIPETIEKIKVDPLTGRRMIVVGYRWMIESGDPSYQNEHLEEIWHYVNDEEKIKRLPAKAQKIGEKKDNNWRSELQDNLTMTRELSGEDAEQRLRDLINQVIDLSELDIQLFPKTKKNVIVANDPAEKAYISFILQYNDIEHEFTGAGSVRIILANEYKPDEPADTLLITKNAIDHGCLAEMAETGSAFTRPGSIIQLNGPVKGYQEYIGKGGRCWCCSNLYGITHICLNAENIQLDCQSNGVFQTEMRWNGNRYDVLCEGRIVGRLSDAITEVISSMVADNEISDMPDKMEGISIRKEGSDITVFGIARLGFIGY